MIIPVILSGGSGTRLWPLSRRDVPKQYLPLVNEKTMFQNTLARLKDISGIGPPVVVCNEVHRFMVVEQLDELGIKPHVIILEPVGRNTAPAIAVSAFYLNKSSEDQVCLVLPADHHIENIDAFQKAVADALPLAQKNYLVTFGIVPTCPATGYGYIEKDLPAGETGAYNIGEFVEKPDLPTAQKYIASENYFWNSGMFMFRAVAYLEELGKFSPEIFEHCQKAEDCAGRDLDFLRLDTTSFKSCPGDSIDYAVMEKTRRGVVMPLDAGWSDVGSWEAIWDIKPKDRHGNVIKGDVVVSDVKDCYIQAESRLFAGLGLEGFVVVETSDALMIAPKNRVQDVKSLVQTLKKDNRHETIHHNRVYRPWGSYETIELSERFQVKKIIVKPGAKLSLQKHFHRAEHWVVVKGTAKIIRDSENIILSEDQSTYIPLGTAHRLENPGKIPLELIEIQTGSYLGEDDIVRIEDDYKRL
jgi:mannose-1-phosphate guanylyltransferase/mannose-6-phosphate isomerase